MGLFGSKSEGGMMDVIRCDEKEYLVWKWHPSGEANSTKKENAIRWGSSLRVKDGELAVFVYKQKDGILQDFIEGPNDDIIKTANFPVITGIIGLAYAGKSPFQAEVYFINLAGNIQIKFGIPYFDVFDPRFLDFGVPTAVRGTITLNITDYRAFIKLQRLINFEIDDLKNQIKDAVAKYVKATITNIPAEKGIPVLQLETKILEINDLIQPRIKETLENDFGVNLKRFDLATIEFDKESENYHELRRVTAGLQTKKMEVELDIDLKDKSMQVDGKNINVFQIDKQTEVLKAAAESLGTMGNIGGGDGGGGMNPAGMMTGMMMGGAMGNQMAGMMNNIGQNQQQNTPPPPPPQIQYCISVNGQTSAPFNWQQLQQMVQNGQLKKDTYVWKQGMAGWELAGSVQELAALFAVAPPPPPPPPPAQ
jgi:membrane protease subunit (stomatin/prohibitin family)